MISVIIPAYKAVNFLEECIDSVVNQNNSNIKQEILLGIDHCEDTYQLVLSSELIKKHCKVFNFEKNVGTYLVLNSLITSATYDNILFFGADDIMFNGLLHEAIDELKYFDIIRWKYYNFQNSIENSIDSQEHSPGAFATKKNLLLKLNGFFPWRISADWEFQLRAKNNNYTTFLSHNYFYRRIHLNNMIIKKDTGMNSYARKVYIDYIEESTRNDSFLNPDKLYTAKNNFINFQE